MSPAKFPFDCTSLVNCIKIRFEKPIDATRYGYGIEIQIHFLREIYASAHNQFKRSSLSLYLSCHSNTNRNFNGTSKMLSGRELES